MGEGVLQETAFALTPSPNLSPKGERNMKAGAAERAPADEADQAARLRPDAFFFAFGLALAGFLSVILAIVHSLQQ